MEYYSSHINKLIEQLSHLPGIGAKSAQRLASHIMNMPVEQVAQLTDSIKNARSLVFSTTIIIRWFLLGLLQIGQSSWSVIVKHSLQ